MDNRLTIIAQELGIPNSLLAKRNLRVYEEAEQLEVAEIGADGREYLLISTAAAAWRELQTAAAAQGVIIYVVSAFRGVDFQAALIRRKLDAGLPIEQILTVLAPPGFSEHHTGCAVDVSTTGMPPATLEFAQTSAFEWLMARAHEFGFYLSFPQGNPEGFQYEPWHWCFRGT